MQAEIEKQLAYQKCKPILGLHLIGQLQTGLSNKNCQLILGRVNNL